MNVQATAALDECIAGQVLGRAFRDELEKIGMSKEAYQYGAGGYGYAPPSVNVQQKGGGVGSMLAGAGLLAGGLLGGRYLLKTPAGKGLLERAKGAVGMKTLTPAQQTARNVQKANRANIRQTTGTAAEKTNKNVLKAVKGKKTRVSQKKWDQTATRAGGTGGGMGQAQTNLSSARNPLSVAGKGPENTWTTPMGGAANMGIPKMSAARTRMIRRLIKESALRRRGKSMIKESSADYLEISRALSSIF